MNPTKRAYLELHIAVLLFGFTAILGDLISISEWALVWWRVLITSFSFLLLAKWWKTIPNIPKTVLLQYIGIGVIVSLHWVTFYGCIKVANASVTLVCMATTSFFTSFLEPLILRSRMKWLDVLLGLLIIPGMYLIIDNLDSSLLKGVPIGLTSAALAATFAVMNKRLVNEAPPLTISLIEMSSATLFLSLIIPFLAQLYPEMKLWPQGYDWLWLIILSLLCTTLAYVLSLRSLKELSAFTANLSINLEPVYGILLAAIILKEHEDLNSSFYMGSGIIILVVFLHPILSKAIAKERKTSIK